MDLNKANIKFKYKFKKKKLAIKNKIKNKQSRPRLCIYKSSKNIYVQVIDDLKHHTLCSISTLGKIFPDNEKYRCNKKNTEKIGLLLAEKIKEQKINALVLDRNGYKYHGIIKKLADVLRENGIII